jgi:hypothetical protein
MNGSDVLKIEDLQWMTMSSLLELQLQDRVADCPGEKHYLW